MGVIYRRADNIDMEGKYQILINFVEEIGVSYKKYIGQKSLYLLECYLNGFKRSFDLEFDSSKIIKMRSQVLSSDLMEIGEFFQAFQIWIGQKYSNNWQSWCNIIRFYTDNEEQAFETFYDELRLFCESDTVIKSKKIYCSDEISECYGVGNIQIYGHNIDPVIFKKVQYNNIFYQKLWKLLTMLKNAPFLFIGEKSLSLANIYIRGFIDAYNLRCERGTVYEFFPGFEEWVNQKAELNLYRPWYKVILFLSVTEGDAFDLLFNYLEEYTESKFEKL